MQRGSSGDGRQKSFLGVTKPLTKMAVRARGRPRGHGFKIDGNRPCVAESRHYGGATKLRADGVLDAKTMTVDGIVSILWKSL